MSDTNSSQAEFEFLVKEFPLALSSRYSEQQFINYIIELIKLRQAQGDTDLTGKEYQFHAGTNMQVDVSKISDNLYKVTYSYIESESPVIKLPTITKEYGDIIPSGGQSFTLEVVRGTSPFFSIVWNDTIPPIDEDEDSLSHIEQNQSYTNTVTNASEVDGNGLVLASGGEVQTKDGQTYALNVGISRQTRYFWGTVVDPNNVDLTQLQSSLSQPSVASVDHGSEYSHFVMYTTKDIKVKASGIDIQAVKSVESITPNSGNPAYFKEYKKYVSPGTSTGTFDYTIE